GPADAGPFRARSRSARDVLARELDSTGGRERRGESDEDRGAKAVDAVGEGLAVEVEDREVLHGLGDIQERDEELEEEREGDCAAGDRGAAVGFPGTGGEAECRNHAGERQ